LEEEKDQRQAWARSQTACCKAKRANMGSTSQPNYNKMLDICNPLDNNNIWFVAGLFGAVGLNLIVSVVLCAFVCLRGAARGAGGGGGGGGREDLDFEQPTKTSMPAGYEESGRGEGGGSNLMSELTSFKRQLLQMERKIDNKRVNEITASYMLHNAHDAIGNHVPTAAQVLYPRASMVATVVPRNLSLQTPSCCFHVNAHA
jgi:hypothetical protein